ncbi:Uncharacterised protein [Mycobacteroides abscessus subsp. abscessus]|nr:Uncharacterised protein [Mycobacteroides abscessus subsp. abscessus]
MELIEATHVIQGHRVTGVVGLVHRHGGHHAGHEAHELGGELLRGGTGLAGRRQSRDRRINVSGGSLALRDGLEGRHDRGDLLDIEDALGGHVAAVEQLAVRVLDLLDDVGGDALATVRDRRVGGRQVDVVRRGGAQDVEQLVVQTHRVLGDTRVDGGLERILRLNVVVQAHEHRVHRVRGRLHEGDVTEGVAAVVRDGGAHASEVLRRLARVGVVDRATQARVRKESERLEGRASHRDVLRDGVLLTLLVIRARVLSEDLTRGRIHGRQGHVLVRRIPAIDLVHALGGRDGLLLVLLDDRGGDAQTTLADLVLIELAGSDQLLLDLGHQVAIRAGHRGPIERVGVDGVGEHRGVLVCLCDPAVLNHEVQVALPALLRLIGVDGGVPRGGRGDDGREERRLGQGQLRGAVAEVRLGGRVDAVRATTEVDRVHVGTDDLVLGLLTVDLDSQDGFLKLARVGRGLADVVALHVLLRQRRTTLAGAASQVVDEGAENALQVNTRVRVERAILGGHDRLRHVVGKRRRVDDLTVDVTQGAHLGRAVGVVDRGLLRERQVIRRGHGQRVVEVQEHRHARDEHAQEDGQN